MSKELEVLLEEIKLVANRHYISSCDNQITKINCLQVEDEIYRLVGKIEILLKTTPTADEVCKALSDYWGNPVQYDERRCLFEMYIGDNTWKPVELLRMRIEKPHIITLIGRFYEKLEEQ
ncbi:hypothetical protein [Methanoculleus sp.]|uniref:hypothetical protein n=1 Tax=Methanoculleus sp. TaxID=90427 RepID=UPI0025F0ABCD|nr:hypothetical protein [Methanoculleus sp.]MCK9319973.1 hypothetical protein [Methanoculleus sp.]